jgi:hypothetical protein
MHIFMMLNPIHSAYINKRDGSPASGVNRIQQHQYMQDCQIQEQEEIRAKTG